MKEKLIKNIVFVLFLIWIAPVINGQAEAKNKEYKIIRSNVGVGGSSKTIQTSKGKYVISQSVGQSSVIGTTANNGYYLRQGFQQPHKPIEVVKSSINGLNALVYPNPFDYNVQISFGETISKNITVEIYDVAGKLLYLKNFSPSQKIRLDLTNLSSGSYLLKAISNGKLFNSKLIKK